MTLICCVDDNMGMTFNKRRQSRDIEVTNSVINLAKNGKLFINPYSKKLFEEAGFIDFIIQDDSSLDFPDNSYFFNETAAPSVFEKAADEIILFRWNRAYPGDIQFDINLNSGWKLISSKDMLQEHPVKIIVAEINRAARLKYSFFIFCIPPL